ncbi:MAG TPA: NAD(P)-dependent oxidoreductase [Xanthobacteraceae bacterium]|nr:NAD(P)-dependent oxidoreductase [Xanthobacteraceae bacterium]
MQTVGVIGLGKIGLPMAENLIRSGHRVIGFRRGDMAQFERLGGIPAQSSQDVGAQADIVLSCVKEHAALADVMAGERGLVHAARPGQIIVELGSHPVRQKQSYVAPLAAKGAVLLDGEVSGTPGMVSARKAVVFLGGDEAAARAVEPVVKGFTDACVYFGAFGTASRVKLINNLLVAINIAATAEAMALGRKAGVDIDRMVQAISAGSGSSTQFVIRAPWMAQKRFMPPQGTARGLSGYFPMIDDFVAEVDGASPLFARAVEIFRRAIAEGYGDQDAAVMVEALAAWPRMPD